MIGGSEPGTPSEATSAFVSVFGAISQVDQSLFLSLKQSQNMHVDISS